MSTSASTIGGALNLLNLNLRFRDAIKPLFQNELPRYHRRAVAQRLDKLQDVVRECSEDDVLTTVIIPSEDELFDPFWVKMIRGAIYLLAQFLRWRMALSKRSGVEWRIPI